MAPRQESNTSAGNYEIPIEEIIFSCGVCQATVSELYADKDQLHGLSSSEDESGVIPKLWIAECSHIFCGKHLAGGGAPFHSKHEPPKALCPVCVNEQKRGREEKKSLFPIRGLGKGEYDEAVPDAYLRVPPVKLDASDPDMDAMRFQYSHLVHYAKHVTKSWKIAEKKRRAMEHTLSKERKQWRKQEAEMNDRIAALEKTEAKLKKWEARRAMIDHYLGLVAKMSDDIKLMRGQLLELGFEVPESQYAFEKSKDEQPGGQQQTSQAARKKQSSATLAASSSSRKRKHPTTHGDYADEEPANGKENRVQPHRDNSRDLMPPPLNKTQPPPRRSEQSQPRSVTRPLQPIPIYEDQQWRGTDQNVSMQDRDGRVPTASQHPDHHNHGALPFRPTQVDARQNPILSYQPTQGQQERVEEYDMSGPAAQPVPGSFLSMPPRRRSQQYMHSQINGPVYMAQHDQAPQYSDFIVPRSETQQPAHHVQQPFYDPPVSRTRPMGPPNTMLSTPSLRKPLEPFAAPAASPFFANRSVLQRPDTIQRPPARGSIMHHEHAPHTRDSTMGRQYGTVPRHPAQPAFQRPAVPPSSSLGPRAYAQTRVPQSQPRYYRQHPLGSQAPPMSDGVFQRTPPPGQQAFGRPTSEIHAGRITLPPSRSRPSFMGPQDLSMIPGARGGAPSQHMYGRQSLASGHNPSRYLSSVGGTRRLVQR